MRVAAALLSGEWLGTWGSQPVSHITLAKGPGYPLFVAAIRDTGLSPQIAAFLLYLTGALLLVVTLRPVVGWPWAVALYVALAFSPQVMSVAFSRPYRDQLVAALALLAFGASAFLGRCLTRSGSWSWARWVQAVAATVLVAGSLGWLAITRPDTVWIVLACFAILVLALLPVARGLGTAGWARVACALLVVLVAVLVAPRIIAALNDRHYGVRLADDYSQGSFSDAIRVWSSVQAAPGEPFMLVTEPQRQAVYAVSPAAREVQAALEDPDNPWSGVGCGWRPQSWLPCTEFAAFFGWAIRDAAYVSGHRTAADFQQYFARLTQEIEAACSAGSLRCGPKGLSADLPPIDRLSSRVAFSGAVNLAYGGLIYEDNLEAPQEPVPQDQALVSLWENTMPNVRGLVDLLNAGQNPETLAQQSTVNVLKRLYSLLSLLALAATMVGVLTGVLCRTHAGRLSLVSLAAWLANIAIVAVVFAATNRQFVGVVPSYTVPGQAFLITGLVLSTFACWRSLTRRTASAPEPAS